MVWLALENQDYKRVIEHHLNEDNISEGECPNIYVDILLELYFCFTYYFMCLYDISPTTQYYIVVSVM